VGVGFVCGAISGGLEILDFETEPAYRAFVTLCEGHDLADAITAMPLSRSGRGGYHLLYRTDPCLHGIKLARTPDARTLIEFRGEGQYAIEAPSPIECGEGDRPYEQLRGNVDRGSRRVA
jgi:putative DNA primase/helicase